MARRRSFAAAAESLLLSQAAVSEQVKRVESVLGMRLLDRARGRRGVDVTEAGRVLLAASEEILARLEQAGLELQALQSIRAGSVAFGAEPAFGGFIMPRIVRDFDAVCPGADVTTAVEFSRRLAESVQQGRLDLAVVVADLPLPGLRHDPIGGYGAICVARPELSGAAASDWRTIGDAARLPWILPKPGFLLRRRIDQLAEQAAVRFQVALELDSNEAKVKAALDGLGVAPVSSHAAAPWLASGQLVELPVEGFPIHIPWEVISRPEGLRPAAEAFRQHLLSYRDRLTPRGMFPGERLPREG